MIFAMGGKTTSSTLAVVDSHLKGQDVLEIPSSSTARWPNAARWFWKSVVILWASPYSLIGLAIGGMGKLGGGRGRLREGVLEFYGGPTSWIISHLPACERVQAITLGHVVLGQSDAVLLAVSEHERVHVRQFEKWGPVMGPAYMLASAWQWAIGHDPYRDNPFEQEAFAKTWEEP